MFFKEVSGNDLNRKLVVLGGLMVMHFTECVSKIN